MKARHSTAAALAVAASVIGGAGVAAIAPNTPTPTRITFQTTPVGQVESYELDDLLITSSALGEPGTPAPIDIVRSGKRRFARASNFSIGTDGSDFTQIGSAIDEGVLNTITWTYTVGGVVASQAFTGNLKIEGVVAGRHQFETINSPRDIGVGLPTGGIVATFDASAQMVTFRIGDKTVRRKLVPTAGSLGIIDTLQIYAVDESGQPIAARIAIDDIVVSPRCTIVGTNQSETIVGTPGDDVICGLGGNDVIRAGAGNDIVIGGPGNDTINGQAGNDDAIGGPGNDRLDGARGTDVCIGHAGTDTATAACETTTSAP